MEDSTTLELETVKKYYAKEFGRHVWEGIKAFKDMRQVTCPTDYPQGGPLVAALWELGARIAQASEEGKL